MVCNSHYLMSTNDSQVGIRITHGLMPRQVIQRNADNVSEITIRGHCTYDGVVEVRVLATENHECLDGFDFRPMGTVASGNFLVPLIGIPVGGPYDIHVRLISDEHEEVQDIVVEDVLVGDVWLLAGQSNMQGCGYLELAAEPHAEVRAFYMDDRWDVARDPIHNVWAAADRIHIDLLGDTISQYPTHIGTGPGVAFGKKMREITGVPQGLIACAHGATSMKQWDPTMQNMAGGSLYGALMRRFHKNGER